MNSSCVQSWIEYLRYGRQQHIHDALLHSPMSATQSELSKGHRALLDLEGRFNAKSHGVVLGIQGSQIEALASCIDIFDQFPYPVIINAAILKLADWFRLRYVYMDDIFDGLTH